MTDTTQTEVPESPSPRSRRRGGLIFLRDVALIILAAIVISFLIKTFLVRSFYIPSESMSTTLEDNDRVIVNELQPKVFGLARGDVVVFQDPGGWLDGESVVDDRSGFAKGVDAVLGFIGLTAPETNDHLIKRIIGLPGDRISCCGDFGRLEVNGVPIDEPYITLPDGETNAANHSFDVTVPDGDIWVMGDNRYNSADSLYHYENGDPGKGFVPISDVVGRAFVISWPVSRWTWLSDYSDVFEAVERKSTG